MHYDVLLNSPRETIAEIAAFLDITVDESFWPTLLNNVSFDFMKSNGEVVMGQAQESFKGGAQTFINRGQSGGWRDILTAQENARYQEVASNTLPPAARHWLECGEFDQPVPRG